MRATVDALARIDRKPYLDQEGVGEGAHLTFRVSIHHGDQTWYGVTALILSDQETRRLIVELADQLPEVDRPPKRRWWRK